MNFTLNIPAGKTAPLNCGESDFFAVVLAGVDLQINVPGSEPALYAQGDSYEMPPGQVFRRLEIRNPSLADTVVIIFAGLGRYRQQRQALLDAPSRMEQVASAIPAGGELILSGVASGDRIRRRSVVVSNPDTALDVLMCDDSGAPVNVVFPRSSAILQTSQPMRVKNPHGAAVAVYVSECWWVAGV